MFSHAVISKLTCSFMFKLKCHRQFKDLNFVCLGDGIRAGAPSSRISEEESSLLRQLVSGIIIKLCESVGSDGQLYDHEGFYIINLLDEDEKRMSLDDGCKKLSLILVEIISPDIMYNGIPWPEEEFIKVHKRLYCIVLYCSSCTMVQRGQKRSL